jgi:hypothetical protein
MKVFAFFLAIVCTSNVFSQDTMYTKEGSLIPGKVIEISETKITYKKSSYLDGPLYVINRSTISKIDFSNGTKEVLPDVPSSKKTDNAEKTPLTIIKAKNGSSEYTFEGAVPSYYLRTWSVNRNYNYRPFIFWH